MRAVMASTEILRLESFGGAAPIHSAQQVKNTAQARGIGRSAASASPNRARISEPKYRSRDSSPAAPKAAVDEAEAKWKRARARKNMNASR